MPELAGIFYARFNSLLLKFKLRKCANKQGFFYDSVLLSVLKFKIKKNALITGDFSYIGVEKQKFEAMTDLKAPYSKNAYNLYYVKLNLFQRFEK